MLNNNIGQREPMEVTIDLNGKEYHIETQAEVGNSVITVECRFSDGETMFIEGERSAEGIIWIEKDEHTHSHLAATIGNAVEAHLKMEGKL